MMKQLSKRVSIILCAAALLAFSVMSAFAQSRFSDCFAVTDDASLFTSGEFETICTEAGDAGAEAGFQVVVHTDTAGVDPSDMDSYYNRYHDSDPTYKPDGVMLVFDTVSDSRIILTYGSAEKYFDDARMEELKSAMKPALSSGDYSEAARIFIKKTDEFVISGVSANGSYSNIVETKSNEPKLLASLKKFGWIGGLAGLVIAVIFVLVNVGRYKYNGKGGTYDLNRNSQMTLLDSQDVFLSKHTTYTTIQSSSDSGSSGGSDSHGSSGAF